MSRAETEEVNQISVRSSFSILPFKTMDFETFRNRFSVPDRLITLEQFRALSLDELNALIHDAGLSRPDAGQARLYHPSSAPTGESINEFCCFFLMNLLIFN